MTREAADALMGAMGLTTAGVRFTVVGVPAPKGSARAITNKRTGRAVLVASGSNVNRDAQKAWRSAVERAAAKVWGSPMPMHGPIAVSIVFLFARPKSHTQKQRADASHTQKPDVDKLLRSTLDAMTGILFVDDAQCCDVRGVKRWCVEGECPGAVIEVQKLSAVPARSK